MLTRDFTKWVVLAAVIACPIAWYSIHAWLQNFAYRIDIAFWPFLLAGSVVLAIALLTVSYQAIKAATRNPVESLRSE
jgi:putative ABC transport system permease protein